MNTVIDRATITDGRARFRAILHAVNAAHGRALPDYRHTDFILRDLGGESLGNENPGKEGLKLGPISSTVRVVAVPGFLAECVTFLTGVLEDGLAHLENLGAKTSAPVLDGRGGAAHNAGQLRDAIMALPAGETVILVAMSKGAVDTQEMLVRYPETQARIACVVSLVGAVCGSPLVHMVPGWLKWVERYVPMPHCRRHRGEAVQSLTPETRRAFLSNHMPAPGVRYYSLGAAVERERMSKGMMSAYRALSHIAPLNDGQMLLADQILPAAEFLGVLNADHIAVGMPFNRNTGRVGRWVTKHILDQNAFPREVMLEAIVRRVLEDL